MKTTSRPTFDDIVFEGRNKSYGAYRLRKEYPSTVNKSMLLTLSAFALFAGLLTAFRKAPAPAPVPPDGTVVMVDMQPPVPPVEDRVKPPVAPLTPAPPVAAPMENTYHVVDRVPDVPPQTVNPTPLMGDGAAPGLPAADPGPATGNISPVPSLPADPVEVVTLDKAPEFPGGLNKFYEYLKDHMRYSDIAREAGVTGKIYASFVIGADGKPRDVKIIRGLGYGLDEQVQRVLSESPPWEPGILHGKPIAAVYRIPVHFDLGK